MNHDDDVVVDLIAVILLGLIVWCIGMAVGWYLFA